MWCKGIVNGRNAQVKDIIYPLNKTNETLPGNFRMEEEKRLDTLFLLTQITNKDMIN